MAEVKPLRWFAEDPKIGFGLNDTYTVFCSTTGSINLMEYPAAPANLGDMCDGDNVSRWVFVKASSTITAGNVIYINQEFGANNLLANPSLGSSFGATQALSNIKIGFAQFTNGNPLSIRSTVLQVVANTGDYFWALLEADAGVQVNVATTSCQKGPVAVYHSGAKPGSIVTTQDLSTTASVTDLVNLYINTSLDSTTSSTNQSATDCFTINRVRTSVSTTQ